MRAPIIQMLNNELTLEAAESIVLFRDSEEGFDTVEEFLQPRASGFEDTLSCSALNLIFSKLESSRGTESNLVTYVVFYTVIQQMVKF